MRAVSLPGFTGRMLAGGPVSGGLYVPHLSFKPFHVAISEGSHVAVRILSKATVIDIRKCLKADTYEGFCFRSMLQGQFAQLVYTGEHAPCYGTHEGAFSSLFNLPRDLASKYLTSLMLWSILQDGNSAPENELCP